VRLSVTRPFRVLIRRRNPTAREAGRRVADGRPGPAQQKRERGWLAVTVASKGGLGTGESLQVLCVLGTGGGLTGCDGGPCPVSVYRGPETQAWVLRTKYRGPETQVLRAKCNNTRVYCTSLCKNTAVATEGESRFFPVPYITGERGRGGSSTGALCTGYPLVYVNSLRLSISDGRPGHAGTPGRRIMKM